MYMEIDTPGSSLNEMTTEQRIKALRRGVPAFVRNTDSDCRVVLGCYDTIIQNGYWRDVADSEEEYFLEYCKKPKAWFEAIRDKVMTIADGKTITIKDFQQQQAIQLSDATPNPTKGRPAKIDPAQVHQLRDEGLTQKQIAEELGCSSKQVERLLNLDRHLCYHGNINVYNTNDSPPERGNTSEYLAARLARDNPDILERVKAGEFPSMRAAAVAAGIVKARQSFSMTASTTPEAFGNTLLQKLDPEFALRLAEHIVQQLNK
jgi:DNA-binding NarL/FixJ family response regulator